MCGGGVSGSCTAVDTFARCWCRGVGGNPGAAALTLGVSALAVSRGVETAVQRALRELLWAWPRVSGSRGPSQGAESFWSALPWVQAIWLEAAGQWRLLRDQSCEAPVFRPSCAPWPLGAEVRWAETGP